MKPDNGSNTFLAITRSKVKMYEYDVPESDHIAIDIDPTKLFVLSIGILGDIAAYYARNEEVPPSVLKNLLFSAHFFDAYLQSRLDTTIDPYLILLGSTSYYLSDLQGSSNVLANKIDNANLNLDCQGIENLLVWLLQNNFDAPLRLTEGFFDDEISLVFSLMTNYRNTGDDEPALIEACQKLRKVIYSDGSAREILLVDCVLSVVKKKCKNSTWYALPVYSDLSKEAWSETLRKHSFIKELWPAQHLIGREGVFKGKSAIVQMPTSAGKTKSTELIIRSAFLADRTSLVVIVAPFKALCHEIKNSLANAFEGESIIIDELSDTLQSDFDIDDLLSAKKVLVVTPEKLLYVLRHNPEIASNTGLLVLDEGHQFDSGIRGITYELLLTSLKLLLPETTQKILISAVISNADVINTWFNGENSVVVNGVDLIPTFKSLGFASWLDSLGQIRYVSNSNIEEEEFFVPRVMESLQLERKPRERITRVFPSKSDGRTVSLYLGLKLVHNGGVAIFCGTKQSVSKICAIAVDIFERDVQLRTPLDVSDSNEVEKLSNLYASNLGDEAILTRSAKLGIFSHHGNTPHGIRLAVEHSMREGFINFVICTSTLSQGVNLPIRYLIVSGIYQGAERIKTRDFHNLIGRAGRSGMHTEGSILFADPLIYDRKRVRRDNWRWEQIKEILEPTNSEPCISKLLSLFDPIRSDDGESYIVTDAMTFVKTYVDNPAEISGLSQSIVDRHRDKGFSKEGVEKQIAWKMGLISAIESFLMSNWNTEEEISESSVDELAKGTLAYYLADDEKKEQMSELFRILSQNIIHNITDSGIRIVYGKTLYGMWDAKEIEGWVSENINNLINVEENSILDLIWPLLAKHIKNSSFNKCSEPSAIHELSKQWLSGKSFIELLGVLADANARHIRGTGFRDYNIEDVVELCENGFAFDGSLLIGALIEFVEKQEFEEKSSLIRKLQTFQKKMRYGLSSSESIILYELGFSDRTISQAFAEVLGVLNNKFEVKTAIADKKEAVERLFSAYPSYYLETYKRISS